MSKLHYACNTLRLTSADCCLNWMFLFWYLPASAVSPSRIICIYPANKTVFVKYLGRSFTATNPYKTDDNRPDKHHQCLRQRPQRGSRSQWESAQLFQCLLLHRIRGIPGPWSALNVASKTVLIPFSLYIDSYWLCRACWLLPGLEILWGICTFAQSRVANVSHLYALRFLVGMLEAPVFAGTHFILGTYLPSNIMFES